MEVCNIIIICNTLRKDDNNNVLCCTRVCVCVLSRILLCHVPKNDRTE